MGYDGCSFFELLLNLSPVEPQRKRRYLDFERPLQELDDQIQKLKAHSHQSEFDVAEEIAALEKRSEQFLKNLFQNLSSYQIVQIARHPDRPSALDYIGLICEDFIEFAGDRAFSEDKAIVGGIAKFEGQAVMILAHQKGRNTNENRQRNFGMPRPEGYRKAYRLMLMAERWNIPIISLIDTPGAYPGIEAEERGQAQAIAENIMLMTDLKVPILSVIIGEGGSGGALALAVSDRMLMLQYSIYSVISPEGCAAITWKDGSLASKAAEALKLTSDNILNTGIAQRIIPEPLGGAHRNTFLAAQFLRAALQEELKQVLLMKSEDLIKKRYDLYRKFGSFEEDIVQSSVQGAP